MPAITLLLHNIRSAHNVGSIFRTADGLGIKSIVLTGYTPYPRHEGDRRLPHLAEKITKQIDKTALGAALNVPFTYHEDVSAWLESNTLPLIALEQSDTSVPLNDAKPPSEFVLVLGEEVHGIPLELHSECEMTVEIPMVGKKESFNVSIAAAIALYVLSQ